MSETTTTSATSANADRAWEQFVPQGTRDNYAQMARDAATINGTSPTAELRRMAEGFEQQHASDLTGGWDYLAAWARQADPAEGQAPDPLELARARAIESARRDPQSAIAGDPAVATAALEALEARSAPDPIDLSTGVVPNTGPLTVDVPSSAERAAAAAGGTESTDTPTTDGAHTVEHTVGDGGSFAPSSD